MTPKHTKYTQINKNKSTHSKMGQDTIWRYQTDEHVWTHLRAAVWSRSRIRSPPESGFWPGVKVSHLKETPIRGPICLIWTFV